MQKQLASGQIESFYHDQFVSDQVRHFVELASAAGDDTPRVVDIGGGCGFFARALEDRTGRPVVVVDSDARSIDACLVNGVEGMLGDALNPPYDLDGGVVCFNMLLHHLVGATDAETERLQRKALARWLTTAPAIYVNEYIYDSHLGGFSARLIYELTSSKTISAAISFFARWFPSMRANTLGVGVRFRPNREWLRMFESLGYRVAGVRCGDDEPLSVPMRLMLVKSCRRDSFWLIPDGSVFTD